MQTKSNGISPINRRTHKSSVSGRDEVIDSIVNKLVTPRGETNGSKATTRVPTQNDLMPIMRNNIQRTADAEYIFEVLPDLELVAQVVISSILSSKDMITTAIVYDCKNTDLPLELKSEMIKYIKNHFDDEYKLPDYLYDILFDVMFKSGSYAAAIIPETSVDAIINDMGQRRVSTEEFKQSLQRNFGLKGLLGPITEVKRSGVGLEALGLGSSVAATPADLVIKFPGETLGEIHLTDNFDVVKLQKAQQAITKSKVANAYNVAVEADGQTVYDRSSYKSPLYQTKTVDEVRRAEDGGRPSVGHPLVMHLPSESVIPVHVPGDFKIHVGYLVLLDNAGNPVSRHDLINNTMAWSWINGDASSQLIKDAAQGMGLGTDKNEQWTINHLNSCYADLVEDKLLRSLNNGAYGDSVTIARPQEVYRIMMARSLAKKNTQILYIPSEQLTYFALDYHTDGTGRSMTDKTRVVAAARSAVAFATMQGSILNATRTLQYDITLDPDDREPEKSIDDIQYRINQGQAARIPFTGTINDVESYFANAGNTFNIEGNAYYPSTKTSVSDVTPDYKIPDKNISDDLARQHYRGFGADPDLILTPESIEFAAQVFSKDLIATKQTCKNQEKLAPHITHLVKTYTVSSGTLLKGLADLVKEHLSSGERALREGEVGHYINMFLGGLSVTLPPPDMSMLASQLNAFEEEEGAIDKMIDLWLDEDLLGDKVGFDIRRAKAAISNHLKRNWLRKNAVKEDLINLFEDEDMRAELIQTVGNENVKIVEVVSMIMKRVDSRMKTAIDNIEMPEPFGNEGGGGDYGDEFGDGEDEYGDDEDGGEDNDMDLDDDADMSFDDGGDTGMDMDTDVDADDTSDTTEEL